MAVYKDNATGTWRVICRFTNWMGERKQTQKREDLPLRGRHRHGNMRLC